MDVLVKCNNCYELFLEEECHCPYCGGNRRMYQHAEETRIKCSICTYLNQLSAFACQICGAQFKEVRLAPPPLKPKYKSLINCPHCSFENDLSNTECLGCERDLYEQKEETKSKCPICSFKVRRSMFDQHYASCVLSSELIQKEVEQQEYEKCSYCDQKFHPDYREKHQEKCEKKPIYEPGKMVLDDKKRLTKLQIEAMTHMHTKSQKEHNEAKSALLKRIKGLGYKSEDLDNLHFYIENYAPVIIHIHVSRHMEFFIKDTHYRNQFETNKSSGSLSRESRTTWEDRMFDKKYSKATDFERVKYGTINFTNDPKGVKCCAGYGPSYFLLKPHVRDRCTFTDKDSSSTDAVIGTFKFPFKVLSKLSDVQLKAAIEGSRAMESSSHCIVTYKEIQIHGPIEFNKDIERIYVNSNEIKGNQKFLDMVYEFSKRNGVEHDFIKN